MHPIGRRGTVCAMGLGSAPNRRYLIGGGLFALLGIGLWLHRSTVGGGAMTPERWEEWQRDWRWMEALATGRGCIVTPLRIDPPASPIAIAALEAKHGLKMPPQLRELLTRYSARVQFGWEIPSHMAPMEPIRVRNFGGMRDVVWDIAHIDRYAIGNFQGWRRQLADKDISEEPNQPQMWENQFPIADLANGDMLTIDVTLTSTPCRHRPNP